MSNSNPIQSIRPAIEISQNSDEIPMGSKIVGTTLGVGIGMTANFCFTYGMHYTIESMGAGFQKVGSLVNHGISYVLSQEINEAPFNSTAYEEMILSQQARRLNYSMLAAMSVPIQPAVRYCFQQLLDCKPETPLRNFAAMIASSLTSVAISGAACNQLGFEIDTSMLIYNQAVALCLIPAVVTLMKGIDYLTDQLEEMIDSEYTWEETTMEESSGLDPARVTVLDDAVVSKTELIKQKLLSPIDLQLASAA